MAVLSITAANFVPGVNAKIKQGIAGETVTQGQTLYLKTSDNRLYKASANTSAETAIIVGLAANAASAGQPLDYDWDDDDLTVGGTMVMTTNYIAGATAGTLHPVSDLVNGWYQTVCLTPKSTTKAVLKLVPAGAVAA